MQTSNSYGIENEDFNKYSTEAFTWRYKEHEHLINPFKRKQRSFSHHRSSGPDVKGAQIEYLVIIVNFLLE